MPAPNPLLDCIDINTEWQQLITPVACDSVLVTGDVEWQWCSSVEAAQSKGALTTVGSLIREPVIQGPTQRKSRYLEGAIVCYVRATQNPGKLYPKFSS